MTDTSVPTTSDPPARASPRGSLVWNLVSTALLAGLIAWNMGWIWALAAVTGVFVHEYGHVLAINALGSGPGRIQIIPFLGGAASWKTPPSSDFKGVLIALAGPVFGLLAMAPFFAVFVLTGQDRWLGGAFFIAIINLFNLAPAPPLDGAKALGPALARIHPWLERAVLIAIGALVLAWAFVHREIFIGLFVALATIRALAPGPLRSPATPLTVGQWATSVALYVFALGLCAAAVDVSFGGSGFVVLRRLLGA